VIKKTINFEKVITSSTLIENLNELLKLSKILNKLKQNKFQISYLEQD